MIKGSERSHYTDEKWEKFYNSLIKDTDSKKRIEDVLSDWKNHRQTFSDNEALDLVDRYDELFCKCFGFSHNAFRRYWANLEEDVNNYILFSFWHWCDTK